jgi:CheY-like chemotaxis protein
MLDARRLDGDTAAVDERAIAHRDVDGLRRVLYIEDNPANLKLVRLIVGLRPGVELLSAERGRAGLDLARAHRPDLILLDHHLPDMAGDEILRCLLDDPRTRDLPVVILSADTGPGQIRRLLEAGARAYVTKPFDVATLLALIDQTAARSEVSSDR